MAQARERDNPSSPRSSSAGAESFKGTPDTRFTAFSPEGGSSKSSKVLHGLIHSNSATPPAGLPSGSFRSVGPAHLDKDPFVTPSNQAGTRLSPTASAFNSFAGTINIPLPGDGGPITASLSTDLGLSRHLDISSSVSISMSEVAVWLSVRSSAGPYSCESCTPDTRLSGTGSTGRPPTRDPIP